MDKKLILLVEDNPDHQELTLNALQANDFDTDVVIASDGEEALNRLYGENGAEQVHPDLVLLDLKLPKVSGLDVLKRIRSTEETRRVPVIILTTSLEESDIASGYDGGANSYLRKPVNYKDFVEQIGYMVTYWFLFNQNID